MTKVSISGFDELKARLDSFKLKDEVTNMALEKAGEHLREAFSNTVPVLSGALQESMVKSEVVDGKILIGPSQQGPSFRAHFIEFGTSKMPAQPFMQPAFENEKTNLENIMAKEIRKGLKL